MPAHFPHLYAEWTGGVWHGGVPEDLSGFSIDTRTLRAGDLFVAIRTPRRDGHAYLREAREKGAAAAIVSEPDPRADLAQLVVPDTIAALQSVAAQHRLRFHRPVIAVTGSCGKTSTKELLALVLGDEGVHRTEGNLNNHLGVPLSLLGIDPQRHRFAVIEVGINQPGEMNRLAEIVRPDIAIVTTIGAAHLEGLGSLDGVATEKAGLLAAVRPGGIGILGPTCLNYEAFRNWKGAALVMQPSGGRPARPGDRTFSLEPAGQAAAGPRRALWRYGDETPRELRIPEVSRGMLGNIALACAAASRLGIAPDLLEARVMRWRPPPFRGERLRIGESEYYVDCYNANPESMIDGIEAFETAFPDRPRLYVLGCMGELGPSATEWHERVGERLRLRPQDGVVLVGPHAGAYRTGIERAGATCRFVRAVDTAEEARFHVEAFLGAVLLKGSRVYALESALPGNRDEPIHGGREAC